MGKNIVHCGGAGTGGVTKLCNNLSLAISMIGTCEAMALVSAMKCVFMELRVTDCCCCLSSHRARDSAWTPPSWPAS